MFKITSFALLGSLLALGLNASDDLLSGAYTDYKGSSLINRSCVRSRWGC